MTRLCVLLHPVSGFWDRGTTTPGPYRTDTVLRSSFFRWQTIEFENFKFWRWGIDWVDNANRRRLSVVAGLSIGPETRIASGVTNITPLVMQVCMGGGNPLLSGGPGTRVTCGVTNITPLMLRVSMGGYSLAACAFVSYFVTFKAVDDSSNFNVTDLLPLATGAILNRRIVLTAANYLEPYMQYRQRDVRIWAMGRLGLWNSPFRYRVWRIFRVLPRSNNAEHQHGPRGQHCPRHDVAVVVAQDQIYITTSLSYRYAYAYRATLTGPHQVLGDDLLFSGSGYEYLLHIYENYKIFYALAKRADIVDCSKYLPKWWGKFICIRNVKGFPGLQNGGPLMDGYRLVGLGCFEIRYNEDRLLVFTDLRYYVHLIHKYADIRPGDYYEYAYPQWGVSFGWFYDGSANNRVIQVHQIKDDLYPLGK